MWPPLVSYSSARVTKGEYTDIQAELLASLRTKFVQNALKEEEEWEFVLKEGDVNRR